MKPRAPARKAARRHTSLCCAGAGFADDLHARIRFEQGFEPLPQNRVILDQHHPQSVRPCSCVSKTALNLIH
jgi:hypothetical protein